MSRIDNLLAKEGAAAENYEMPEQLPDHVQVSRRSRAKPTVISVRLSPEENSELQRAAQEANLPVSTLVRLWALERLREEEQDSSSVAARLTRLEQEVFQQNA
ncbi:plasmid mobilization protein [Garicola koreensis]|uniref:CopG family transcriptional regulator n=1 Tax=Garicola koreensis TaxID=1262554 RepID=A0A7W5U080_9MICC|nr:CopG family transcriptional regulator [Garicola koreensis]MBB3666856.1 hypothetical protein [Garicola koreensis]